MGPLDSIAHQVVLRYLFRVMGMTRSAFRFAAISLLTAHAGLIAACGESDIPPFPAAGAAVETGTLIVGVTSDYRAGSELTRLDVEMAVDDVEISSDSLRLLAASLD